MRRVWISDITMKNTGGEFTLSFREKIELAKLLDRLGVAVIECGPIVNRKTDSLLVKSLATAVKSGTLAVPVSVLEDESVDCTWAALSEAVSPRLQVPAPVSTVQMEYFCHKKPAAMIELIRSAVARCKSCGCEVEFVAEDAGRSEGQVLSDAIAAAVEAGADVVTVCDTAGTKLPHELYEDIAAIRASIPERVRLGVKCSNELYMADACAMAAVRAGADEVKTAACGEFTASLDKLTRIIKVRGAESGMDCGVRTTELKRTTDQIKWMCQSARSKASPFDSGVRDSDGGEVFTIHDDMDAVVKAVERLGYDLSQEDKVKVFEAFERIASKKESVSSRELDAIVASAALQVPPAYKLESFVINSGNVITATAHIKLKKDGQTLEGVCVGDGPVDAAFLAIEQVAGRHYELDDFQIQAVTEGHEAMGETVVRLRSGGKVYSGRGISTDIIGSSISAYINALNKIVYEEGEA